jgi:alkylation response protein AidB-like acyl-CoA dehydrogenase
MPVYNPPVKDTRFVYEAVVHLDHYSNLPGFESASADLVDAVLEEGGKFAAEVMAPLNQIGDAQGCTRHPDGSVTTPEGFKAAYEQFVAGGWPTLHAPTEFGGQGLPSVVATAVGEYFCSANHSLEMYHGLTTGAINALLVKGTPEQQAKYLPKMVEGTWTGTMNLTEPHCGTDLGLIKTKAVPNADGSTPSLAPRSSSRRASMTSPRISSTSAGEDARRARRQQGHLAVRGAEVLVNDDGSLGARNAVSCGSLEHKMGIHGNATCVMNYDGATGWLVGEENKGLAAMFIMMNDARLGVGIARAGAGGVAYQNAVQYARDRRQGRALTGPAEPNEKADTLFVHPDVRRMLMDAKALTEGLRALMLWGALQVDLVHLASPRKSGKWLTISSRCSPRSSRAMAPTRALRQRSTASRSSAGTATSSNGAWSSMCAMPASQIYEGANGVQAMDLVGRKLAQNGGRALQAFFKIIGRGSGRRQGNPRTAGFAEALEKAKWPADRPQPCG